MRKLLIVALALGLSGCAVFEDLVSVDEDGANISTVAANEPQSLLELSIMTGRYGVMLDQAREILRLPEPKELVAVTAGGSDDTAAERIELARQQAKIANEFIVDAKRACARRRVPKNLRDLACESQRTVPAELQAPTQPEMQALAKRSDQMGEYIMTWWQAVCDEAPKPRDGDPVCPME